MMAASTESGISMLASLGVGATLARRAARAGAFDIAACRNAKPVTAAASPGCAARRLARVLVQPLRQRSGIDASQMQAELGAAPEDVRNGAGEFLVAEVLDLALIELRQE